MKTLNPYCRDCSSVNFVRYVKTPLQQMENMFKTDFNEPMIFSKVEMSVQHQKALSQMENSVKFMNGHYRLQLPWRHISVNRSSNCEFGLE